MNTAKENSDSLFKNLGATLNPQKAKEDLKQILTDIEAERKRDKAIRERVKARCSNATDEELQREAIFGL